MRRNRIAGMLLGFMLCSLASLSRAQSAATVPLSAAELATLRGQVQQFQDTLNRDMQTAIDHPFAMLQDAKGIYLPRFGVVFHMELNLAPLRTLSAFDVRPYTEQELLQARDTKLVRIRELKDHLSDLLRAHGAEMSALPPDLNVAVVVHLFNLPSERTDGLPTQIVIEVSRGVLADAASRLAAAEEFRKKVLYFDF
ncbi:MAG: hypothetical protein HY316_01935 [Acidobacteria bacterium]|nr:hypothetical protein [Acidobacteriota bacterium]